MGKGSGLPESQILRNRQRGAFDVMSMQTVNSPLQHLAYAGDVSAKQAWTELQNNPHAILVDVRTQPEWTFSGTADLAILDKETHKISWKHYPTMEVNPHFVAMVKQVAPAADTPIFFLCKTGGRSQDAAIAMTQEHYTQCFNVEHGFEGDLNNHGQRGTINGWKASGLPWEQA